MAVGILDDGEGAAIDLPGRAEVVVRVHPEGAGAVHVGQVQQLRPVLARLDGPELVPLHVVDAALHERAHRLPLVLLEEQARRADELQRVPLDGIVAGREHQAAARVVVLDRQLAARRRGEADVDHVAAGRHQRRHRDRLEHRARHAAVAADDDARLHALAGIARDPRATRAGR